MKLRGNWSVSDNMGHAWSMPDQSDTSDTALCDLLREIAQTGSGGYYNIVQVRYEPALRLERT